MLISCAGNLSFDGKQPPSGTITNGGTLYYLYNEGVYGPVQVISSGGSQKCIYTPTLGHTSGSVFIVVERVTGSDRQTLDFSQFSSLNVDLQGAVGGESIQVGVKTDTDHDNGKEPLTTVAPLTTGWVTYPVLLTALVGAPPYVSTRFSHLYVVFELVFTGSTPETVSFRNVNYTK